MKRKAQVRRALIVGGARGFGLAVVKVFAADGCCVSVLDKLAPPNLDPRPADVTWHQVDLLDEKPLEKTLAAIETAGALDTLVFLQRWRGAGDPWEGELETSLTTTRKIIERLSPALAKGASIVIVSSVADTLVADEQPVGYHAAKAALVQLARYYAVTLGPRGIRCNSVSPALFIREETRREDEQRYAAVARVAPLRRIPTVDEIARVILFLSGSAAACVTGQNIVTDNGLSLLAHASLVRHLKS